MHFCTGASERKARNLEHNRHCILTTGRNSLTKGLDLKALGFRNGEPYSQTRWRFARV